MSERAVEAAAASAAGGAAGRDMVVSTIVGDRLCVKCGFNLTGQAVVREMHYQMLLARCPECGTAAALQEYPLLGKWANRWAASLAAAWLLLLFAWVLGLGFAVWGMALGASNLGAEQYAEHVRAAHEEWAAGAPGAPGATAGGPAPSSGTVVAPGGVTVTLPGQGARVFYPGWHEVESSWWKGADRRALLAQAGGFRRAVGPDGFIPMLPLVIVCFVFGAAGSVAMLHLRGVRLALVALLPVGIAGALSAITIAVRVAENKSASTLEASDCAWEEVGPGLLLLGLSLGAGCLALGLVSGRPLVRRVARALLPARLCNSLSVLWLTDRRRLPGARRRVV